jgi:hypothetical protein
MFAPKRIPCEACLAEVKYMLESVELRRQEQMERAQKAVEADHTGVKGCLLSGETHVDALTCPGCEIILPTIPALEVKRRPAPTTLPHTYRPGCSHWRPLLFTGIEDRNRKRPTWFWEEWVRRPLGGGSRDDLSA